MIKSKAISLVSPEFIENYFSALLKIIAGKKNLYYTASGINGTPAGGSNDIQSIKSVYEKN